MFFQGLSPFTIPTEFSACIPYYQEMMIVCKEIDALRKEVADLKTETADLEARVKALEDKA